MVITESQCDIVMRVLIDRFSNGHKGYFGRTFIKKIEGLGEIDPDHLLNYLCSEGWIKHVADIGYPEPVYRLTQEGEVYFERQREQKDKEKRQFSHDWKIAVFSAIAGAIASEPLWSLIHLIFGK